MSRPFSDPPMFYPAFCFVLSPTHSTWARLTALTIHALKERPGFEGQNLYFHLNHPIKWIRVIGVVIAVDIYPTRWIILLDDSSGAVLEVTCGRPKLTGNQAEASLPTDSRKAWSLPDIPTEGLTATGRTIDLRGVDIGTVIKAKGGIGSFRGEKQMLLERISIVYTTNEEAASWAENAAFQKDVLNVPWFVSKKEEKQARKKAEGLDREHRRREDRKRKQEADVRHGTRLKSSGDRHAAAVAQEESAIEDPNPTAEKKKREQAKRKRAQQRRLRQQEFERLQSEKESTEPPLEDVSAAGKGKEEIKGINETSAGCETQPCGDDVRASVQAERRERSKRKRDEERRERALEFDRLKRLKDGQTNRVS